MNVQLRKQLFRQMYTDVFHQTTNLVQHNVLRYMDEFLFYSLGQQLNVKSIIDADNGDLLE